MSLDDRSQDFKPRSHGGHGGGDCELVAAAATVHFLSASSVTPWLPRPIDWPPTNAPKLIRRPWPPRRLHFLSVPSVTPWSSTGHQTSFTRQNFFLPAQTSMPSLTATVSFASPITALSLPILPPPPLINRRASPLDDCSPSFTSSR